MASAGYRMREGEQPGASAPKCPASRSCRPRQTSGTLRDGYLGRRGRCPREGRVVRTLLDRARAGVIFAGAGVAPVALWLPESPKRRHAAPRLCTLATLPIFTRFAETCFERARPRYGARRATWRVRGLGLAAILAPAPQASHDALALAHAART